MTRQRGTLPGNRWLGQQMQFDRLKRRAFLTLLGGAAYECQSSLDNVVAGLGDPEHGMIRTAFLAVGALKSRPITKLRLMSSSLIPAEERTFPKAAVGPIAALSKCSRFPRRRAR